MQLSSKSIRREIKYKVFLKDIGHLYSWLYSSSGFRKSYKDRGVNSLYFDTPTYDFASSNMSGESKRIKVRARWYSEIGDRFIDSYISPAKTFNFEVKRKENSLSDKLLIGKHDASSTDNYAKRSMLLTKELNKLKNVEPVLCGMNLQGTVFINYQREYYENLLFPNIRLTVDKNIYYGESNPFNRLLLLSRDYLTVELKFKPEDSSNVDLIMREFPCRQVRSSKFLAAIAQIKQVSY